MRMKMKTRKKMMKTLKMRIQRMKIQKIKRMMIQKMRTKMRMKMTKIKNKQITYKFNFVLKIILRQSF